jgi:uncharacterized membrane protein
MKGSTVQHRDASRSSSSILNCLWAFLPLVESVYVCFLCVGSIFAMSQGHHLGGGLQSNFRDRIHTNSQLLCCYAQVIAVPVVCLICIASILAAAGWSAGIIQGIFVVMAIMALLMIGCVVVSRNIVSEETENYQQSLREESDDDMEGDVETV